MRAVPQADSCSYGAGVQSTALLVLAATGRFDCRLFLFANVGDDSEHPDSLRYFRQVAMPYAAANGIELVELRRTPVRGRFKGEVETLWGRMMHPHSRRLPIPVFMSGGAITNRACTADFKIDVVSRELKQRGATAEHPWTVALGISVDEIERAKPGVDPRNPEEVRTYPLLDLGITRTESKRIIAKAALPVPGKSACFFCPYHDKETWRALKRDDPDLFAKACELEARLSEGRSTPVFLTKSGIPLADTLDDQLTLDGMDGCDSGWCMT